MAIFKFPRRSSVCCLDVAPYSRFSSETNSEGLTLLEGDVRDSALIDDLVGRARRVIHLAAVVGVDDYMQRPAEVLDVNIMGTRLVFDACLKHDRPVLFTSSSEVYGTNTSVLHEDSDRIYGRYTSPRWSYAISKAVGEQYAHALAREGLQHVTTRYFNVYGPGLDRPGAGRVVSKFLGCIQEGRPLTLVDGGVAIRSFCYVDEAIDATAQLALSLGVNDRTVGRAFNIGRAEAVSMRTLAELMIELSGHTAGTVDVSGESHFGAGFQDIPKRVPSTQALREAIGFEATIGLREGLSMMLQRLGMLREQ